MHVALAMRIAASASLVATMTQRPESSISPHGAAPWSTEAKLNQLHIVLPIVESTGQQGKRVAHVSGRQLILHERNPRTCTSSPSALSCSLRPFVRFGILSLR